MKKIVLIICIMMVPIVLKGQDYAGDTVQSDTLPALHESFTAFHQ